MTGGLETSHTLRFNYYLVQCLPRVSSVFPEDPASARSVQSLLGVRYLPRGYVYGSLAHRLETQGATYSHHCREGTSRWGRVSFVGWESLSGDDPIQGAHPDGRNKS